MGRNFKDHLNNLRLVFEQFREYGIKLKAKKCDLCKKEVCFLGRKVTRNGLAIGDEYVEAVKEWVRPENTKQVEQFLGFVNYHGNFIKDYSRIAKPLTEITGKKQFYWNSEQEQPFETLKQALHTTPVLTLPNAHDNFILDTDASGTPIAQNCYKFKMEKNVSLRMEVLRLHQLKGVIVRHEKNFWQ